MKGTQRIDDEKTFFNKLKNLMNLNAAKTKSELYLQGVKCAEEGVPWEEIQNSGRDNEVEFIEGYNARLEELGINNPSQGR